MIAACISDSKERLHTCSYGTFQLTPFGHYSLNGSHDEIILIDLDNWTKAKSNNNNIARVLGHLRPEGKNANRAY